MYKITIQAKHFATLAHKRIGQVRKFTGEPYIVHPIEVADIVRSVAHTPEMIAAAYLHDVVEDAGVSIEEIRHLFGDMVADLVSDLTDVSKPSDGKRAVRKAIDLAHTAKASPQAKTIKLADLISNAESVVERNMEFAAIYLKEKSALLEVLKEGNPTLWRRARSLLDENTRKLKDRKH